MNTHTMVSDLHQNMLKVREDAESQNRTVSDMFTALPRKY